MSAPLTMVVDASVAVKWHLTDEEDADAAALLPTRFSEGLVELVAPDQIRYEVPNAIAVATIGRDPRLTQQQGREAIAEFLGLALTTVVDDELIAEAYPLVHQYSITFYDALYVALAQRLGTPLHHGRPPALRPHPAASRHHLDRRLRAEPSVKLAVRATS